MTDFLSKRLAKEAEDGAPVVLSPTTRRLWHALEALARSSLPVLLLGETGAGKGTAAEAIHAASPRASKPLLRVNCAGLSEGLVDSELFGHERGAFPGADDARIGLFEAADGATLFLDELGELSPGVQAKLLRVLESGEIVRVGSNLPRRVDVRIVSATHRDLPQLVAGGAFRKDLFFRLSGATLHIPPLRERTEEILPLAHRFAALAAARVGRVAPLVSERAASWLSMQPWPGNVRQLRHAMERAVLLCPSGPIEPEIFDAESAATPISHSGREEQIRPSAPPGIRGQVQGFERERIVEALASTKGNQTRAAKILGVSRRTLTNKLNAYGLDRPRKRVQGQTHI